MFRMLSVISVVVAVVFVMLFGRVLAGRPVSALPKPGRFPALEGLIAFGMWCGLLLLAATGFLGAVLPARAMTGYTIVAHFAGAGVLSACFALLAVFRAEPCSLAEEDRYNRFSTVQKLCFWALALCVLGLIGSALIAMIHLLGTDGQLLAMKVHKCLGLAAVLVSIVYAGTGLKRV